MGIHAILLAHFGALATRHPDSAELYRALPYVLEFCAACWCAYTFFVRSVRDQFRAISDATVREQATPAPAELETDVSADGVFQAPNGDWMRLTYDKRGRVDGCELCPSPDGPTVVTPSGSYRLGRLS